jgi:hypothetical protein
MSSPNNRQHWMRVEAMPHGGNSRSRQNVRSSPTTWNVSQDMFGLTFCKQTSSRLRSPSVSSIAVSEELSNDDLNQYFDFSFFPDREILESVELEYDRAAQDYGGEPKLTLDSLPSVNQIVQENMNSWYKMPPFTDPFGLDIRRGQEGSYDSPYRYATKDSNGTFKSSTKYTAWSKEDYCQGTAFLSPQIRFPLSPKLFLKGVDKFDAVSGRSTELTTTSSHATQLFNPNQTYLLRYSVLEMSA